MKWIEQSSPEPGKGVGWGKKQTNRPVSGQFSEEKTGLENRFLVPEILNKYKRSIFLRRPVYIC